MSAAVQINLALILFFPWFSMLAVLFWWYPRQPRDGRRRAFDAASLLLSTLAAAGGMRWSFFNADPQFGPMWRQVLATSVAYGLFLLALTAAWLLRRAWLAGRIPLPTPGRSP